MGGWGGGGGKNCAADRQKFFIYVLLRVGGSVWNSSIFIARTVDLP